LQDNNIKSLEHYIRLAEEWIASNSSTRLKDRNLNDSCLLGFFEVCPNWGSLQNYSLFVLVGRRHRLFHGGEITTWKLGSSLSLGMFIFTARPYDL
jgi:hypothetical protein